ncbi:hypothetical protein DICPUDRAFT_84795 [Dictyostelium purpureum]|uniref:Equilibrative nucleoside transporter n=1 Tax=Dictyostelium purpureum TaxID=5786 RepID=F1A3S0_DICPU|nr:uncharacterized protein DICPUDRAFT_84795 [Dictyostelium purpureum]EGC29160.1 hypothetical protein DICPUDRAFT_84795 [Dictyostelium purpureum]|eukprot:XP_003294313.1 hypothetical protein DICPUDRAFT_84795 [Dictyostelium purpureum]
MAGLTCSVLFPYSSVLSSLDYFSEIYPDYYTTSTLPFVYMFTIAATYCLVLRIHHKTKHHINIIGGFIVYIIVLIIVPFINLSSISGTIGSYIITVILICCTAFVDGFIQSSIMAIAGLFGPHYSIFCQIGYGLSGVISTTLRVIIKFSFPSAEESKKKGIIIFFSLSCLVIVFASLLFVYLLKSPIGKYIMKKDEDNQEGVNEESKEIDEKPQNQSPLKYVVLKNIHYNLILISLFTITLFIYPSFIYKIEFKDIRTDWYMVSIVAVYGVCDFIGRIFPMFLTKRITYKASIIWSITISRLVFVLLFFIQIYFKTFRIKPLVYILLILFGLTDGALSSICVSEPPKQVSRKYKELSGVVTSFAANIGLLIGSAVNLAVMLILF